MLSRSSRISRDESGNLIVALAVITVLTLLGMTVLATTVTSLISVRQNQDFSASLAQADAGLSDALFRIDQFGTNSPSSFCVGNAAACYPTSLPATPTTSYSAVMLNSNTFTVTSLGDVNNRPHAIQATVARASLYPFALFANTSATFNGNADGTIVATLPSGQPDPNGIALVGSNGSITCHGGGHDGSGQVSYSNAVSGCASPTSPTGTYQPQDPVVSGSCPSPNTNVPPVPCVPANVPTPNCPANNSFSGTISGTFYCTGSVTFNSSAPIVVGGSFQLYVVPTTGTANVELASTVINSGGDPRNFSLYVAGGGSIDMGHGSHAATITGTVWAPSATITSNGCDMSLTGAIVIGSYTCNGGPNLTINYDDRLRLLGTEWTVTNYAEIPSSQFSLPGF